MNQRWILWLICFAGGIITLYVSYYNRMVDDDLVMWMSVKRAGILGATTEQYYTWNTRWMSFLFLHTWMWFLKPTSSLLLYHLTTFTLLLLAFLRLVRTPVINSYIRPEMRSQPILAAGLLSLALLICTFDIADTWYWMNTSTMYGWNLIALIFAFGLVLQPVKRNFVQDSLLTFLGLYYGGASEPAVGIFLLAVAGGYHLRKNEMRPYSRHIINFSIGVAVGFFIAWMGVGHGKRDAALPDLDTLGLLTRGGYFTAKIALYHLPLRLLLALPILISIWQPGKFYKGYSLLKTTLRIKLIGIVLLTAHTFFMVWIMGDYGPGRAWSHISLLMVVLASVWILSIEIPIRPLLINALLTIVLTVLLYTGYQQITELPNYRHYLEEVQSGKKIFDPTKVPESGMMHRATMGKVE
ncbi:MAG: hypothetical protein U0Y08_15625 [Bacteroidia bacterium]